jgi:hypothetical protein
MGRGMGHGGGDGMGAGMRGPALGESFPVARFHIAQKVSDSPKLPQSLVKMRKLTERDVSNPDRLASHPSAWSAVPSCFAHLDGSG